MTKLKIARKIIGMLYKDDLVDEHAKSISRSFGTYFSEHIRFKKYDLIDVIYISRTYEYFSFQFLTE